MVYNVLISQNVGLCPEDLFTPSDNGSKSEKDQRAQRQTSKEFFVLTFAFAQYEGALSAKNQVIKRNDVTKLQFQA